MVALSDLLNCLAKCLIEASEDEFQLHAVKITDALIKSLWWMTNQIKPASKSEKRVILLRIRKTLGTLDQFIERACRDGKKFLESGNWTKLVSLESLLEMNKLLPNEFAFIRNIF